MKKLKIIISSILVATALGAGIAAVGCNKHIHTYSDEWSSNSTHHWHEPTCDDTQELGSYGEHRWNGNWVCEDCSYARSFEGLKVTKTKTQYELTKATLNVPVNDIKVTAVDEDGKEADITDYELTYYKGKEKIDSMNKLEGGAYNIWATANVAGEKKEAFVMVYVIDNVTDFQRADSLNAAARTQDLGIDVISDKWNFVVTYSSGRQETVNVRDEHIVRTNFTTFLERENEQSTVTYTELNVIGEATTKSATVSYTIKKNPNSNIVYKNYSFEAITDTLSEEAQKASTTALKQENLIGVNAFLHMVDGGTVNYRGTDSDTKNGGLKLIEIKSEALQITFDGVGVLAISARSTGTSNYSSIAVKGEDGDYVMATYQLSNKNIGKDDDEYIYSVTGDMNDLTFEITKPGTYTIMTLEEVLTDGNTIDTNRNTRIGKIEITDILTREGN